MLGCTPFPRRSQQQKQRRLSDKQFNSGRGQGGGGGSQNKNLLLGPSHPLKVKHSGSEETEDESIKAGHSGPAHPPKITGDHLIISFACDAFPIRS